MNLLNSLILGVVEGITEFLPISSTAHLILTAKLLRIPSTEFTKFFEVFIQSGAILAVIILYLEYIFKHKNIIKNIFLSFIPTAIIGLLLHRIIKDVFFESSMLIIIALGMVGLAFIILEKLIGNGRIKLSKNISQIGWQTALMIGLFQALAVVPGVSRAGIVMVAMMVLGYKRDESAVYSFLLAVPTILAASSFDLYKVKDLISFSSSDIAIIIVGMVTSFITAYLSVKWLVNYLKKNSLTLFGVYRIILAVILALFLK